MAITIRELIAVSSLDLRLIYNGDHDALESGIVWVHPTDVVNAAQFAEPGEILLTCSTNFPLENLANTNDLSLLKRDRRKLGLPSACFAVLFHDHQDVDQRRTIKALIEVE